MSFLQIFQSHSRESFQFDFSSPLEKLENTERGNQTLQMKKDQSLIGQKNR